MSDVVKLSSKDVKRWLESQTGSAFVPVHNKAKKLVDEMRKELGNLQNSCKMLMENSAKEVDKRSEKTFRRARALNKLSRLFSERLQRIKIAETVSYDSFSQLVQDTQKMLTVTDVDMQNWFPRISPYFIMDRRKFQVAVEKVRITVKELSGFLTKDYVKTKAVEETLQLTDKLLALEREAAVFSEQKAKAESEKASIDKEIIDAQGEIAAVKSRGGLSQLTHVETEIEALNAELKRNLQHLQKPFIKLQSLVTRGGGSGLMQEESLKLSQYLETPFEAFATEQAGYPVLKSILEKLDHSMSDKLNLKPEKERKAKQAIDSIIMANSLMEFHQKCVEALAQKRQLLASTEVTAIQTELTRLQERISALERKKKIVESEATVAERDRNETVEKIRNVRSGIEKNVSDFLDKRLHIE